MKKRLLSALLALALVFVLLPTTALAEVVSDYFDCDISILGNYWKFEKDSNNEYLPVYYKSEASSFEDSTVAPENNYLEIRKTGEKEITITVHGDVNITATGISIDTIAANKSVIINGDGHLTVKYTWIESGQNYSAIAVSTLTVEGVALSAEASMGPALSATYGIHIKDGAMVEAKAGYYEAVCEGTGGITVDNATLVATATGGGNPSAIKTYGNIAFTNAKVTATNESSENAAIQAKTYKGTLNYLYVSGTSTITATNQSTSTDTMARAIGATIKNNNTSEKIEVGSSKVDAGKTWYTNAKQVTITSPALEKDSYVYIAGENAVVGQWTTITANSCSGSYYYNAAKKELTLKDVNIASSSIINAIQFAAAGTYTVNLEGTNKISNVSNGISVTDDKYITSLNVTITGTGSLDISAKGLAINMKKGDLKFENTGEIKLTTSNISKKHNVLSVSGDISITDMDKYSVTGITQTGGNVTGDTVILSEASHLKGYQNPDDTWTYLKSITIASKPSETYYNSTAMKYGETRDAGSGTIFCDENGVITLNGATAGTLEFRSSADSTLVLEGTNTLSSIVTTQKGLTISGSGSLTVGSIQVTNNDNIRANLTITDGAIVIAKSNATRAIDIKGDLTVTNGSLKATSTSDNVPTVQVGGNASFTGSTVTITNNSTTQGERYKDSYEVSSALHVNGAVTISGGKVMAEAKAGGNAIRAVGNITVSNDATVTAKNNSQYFNAITAGRATGGEVNTLYNLIVSGENTRITATNTHNNNLAYGGAINAYIENANEGHYLKANTDSKAIAPNDSTTVKSNDLTITRGDEVTPVVIAGTPLLNDTYYTITNGSTVVANGSKDNYNAFYESATKTLKLNNAQISHSFAYEDGGGKDGAIIFTKFENYFIELSGENTISSTNTYAINCHRPDRTLTIKNAAEAENAKLTLTGNWTVICSIGGLNIQSDVTMVNTKEAGYLMYVNDTFSFDGYNAYASVNASGSPLVEYTVPTSGDKDAGYQYLRITKETLETGGGSTHEHVFSTTSWESNADYHWHKCTVQGCTEVSDKEAHVYTNTWWKNSNGNHGRTCDKCRHEGEIHEFRKYYDFVDATYHVERCGYLNCTYVGRQETHSYDSFGVCKCGYSPNGLPAPPSLQGVAPTSENGTDGKILNSNIGMEYAQNLNGPWTKWNEHSNITGLSAGTYYVRYTKTDERFPDNQVATVEVPAYTPGGDPTPDIPAAPTGLVGVAPTSENGNGKITGTTAQMEYASSLEGDWTACANDSTDVPAGKYYVRMKKTDNTPAGEAVEVTVPAYSGTGEIVPPTPDNPGTIVIIRPAEEEKPAQQPNPSTGANDLVGLAVAAAVAAVLGSAALLRKHD